MNVLHIAGRELKMFLISPWTYVVLAATVAILGFFFAGQVSWFAEVSQRPSGGFMGPISFNLHSDVVAPYIGLVGIILIFLMPAFTMNLIAGERRQRSMELLLTSPVSSWEIVLGKFLGAMGLYLVLILMLAYVPITMYVWGNPDNKIMLTTLLGVAMLGSCYVAVGIAASSLSENMVVSAVLGIVVLLLFWVIEIGAVVSQGGWLQSTLEMASLVRHLDNFTSGLIDTKDLVYMGSFSFFFLFVAQQRVESLRWR